MESTYSSATDVSGQGTRCAEQHLPLFRSLDSFEASRKFAKRMTGHSKIEHPFSRTRSTFYFHDTNCEAYEVPLDSGTNDMGAFQFKQRTLWSNSRNTID